LVDFIWNDPKVVFSHNILSSITYYNIFFQGRIPLILALHLIPNIYFILGTGVTSQVRGKCLSSLRRVKKSKQIAASNRNTAGIKGGSSIED